jgi:hypothetical protein
VLSAAHLYLAPAKLESFGIAALEARCAGLPVIGMARSGLSDFIDDGTAGYLVDTDEQMAALTARLLTHPDQLETIRSHNLQHPPSADWAGVLELHRRLYARAGETVAATASAHVATVTQPEAARFRPHEQAVEPGRTAMRQRRAVAVVKTCTAVPQPPESLQEVRYSSVQTRA